VAIVYFLWKKRAVTACPAGTPDYMLITQWPHDLQLVTIAFFDQRLQIVQSGNMKKYQILEFLQFMFNAGSITALQYECGINQIQPLL